VPPNVLLIMVDALRADRVLSPSRSCTTPVLDEWMRSATVFERTYSVASMTTCCTASLLTGTYPFVHGIRSLADARLGAEQPTLAELFRRAGYLTWAETTGPLVASTGLDRGFDSYRHREHTAWLDTPWGDELLHRLRTTDQPWFGFVHLWELHAPRRVPPGFDEHRFGATLYDRAMSAFDQQLRRILDALPPDTVVLLTGDHGEHVTEGSDTDAVARLKRPLRWVRRHVPGAKRLRRFTPLVLRAIGRARGGDLDLYRNWIGHGFHVYDGLVHVPLVLRGGPVPECRRITGLASHVDVLPTLASLLGLELPSDARVDGVDLSGMLSDGGPAPRSSVYLEASGGRTTPDPGQWLAGVRTDRYKYARGLFNDALPEELYDLAADPQEASNIAGTAPEVAAELRQELDRLLATAPTEAPEPAVYDADELADLERRLEQLGYLD
jgi:arylsulfatase A-like enzyme